MTRRATCAADLRAEMEDRAGGFAERNVAETGRRYGIAPDFYYHWEMKPNRERWQHLGERALPLWKAGPLHLPAHGFFPS